MAEITGRPAAGAVRTASEGGLWAAAAVVANQLAVSQWPEVEGVGLLAAATVGAGAAWLANVARNVAHSEGAPGWLKTVLGA